MPSYVAPGDAYSVHVRSVDNTSIKDFSDQVFSIVEMAQPLWPADNYPTPFNPETTIRFSLPTPSQVKVQVYGALGQPVSTLVGGYRAAGAHQVRFAASHLGSGYYLFRIETSKQTLVHSMLLLIVESRKGGGRYGPALEASTGPYRRLYVLAERLEPPSPLQQKMLHQLALIVEISPRQRAIFPLLIE
ncbi:MAG: hypothetical protein ACI8PG_000735 [Planctomycetota bacterium]